MIRYIMSLPFLALAYTFGMIGACFEAIATRIDRRNRLL